MAAALSRRRQRLLGAKSTAIVRVLAQVPLRQQALLEPARHQAQRRAPQPVRDAPPEGQQQPAPAGQEAQGRPGRARAAQPPAAARRHQRLPRPGAPPAHARVHRHEAGAGAGHGAAHHAVHPAAVRHAVARGAAASSGARGHGQHTPQRTSVVQQQDGRVARVEQTAIAHMDVVPEEPARHAPSGRDGQDGAVLGAAQLDAPHPADAAQDGAGRGSVTASADRHRRGAIRRGPDELRDAAELVAAGRPTSTQPRHPRQHLEKLQYPISSSVAPS
ncbi:unnamed protein product [Phytophthora lilii]|uniref:Unnamed protein product n=1 Tax=Phytophthora lilii TaxID=2077276 RepID=A0A9W6WMV7_9STRA|nr:unnamed protein product [Phytophthora lilii]